MNQEQLLDHVASILITEAEKGPGTLFLSFDGEYHVHRMPKVPVSIKEIFKFFDAEEILSGLPPSIWLDLGKKLWSEKSSTSGSIKFPGQPSAAGKKHKHTPIPTDEPPKTG